ncbi:MAG: calcium-binding protein [Caulobacteraceae bacterium]|jgi:Ca2+-binding RTX toxin-like protein|nr:calcium-binding protein [Caulobacteraceae bacterium]
MARNKIEGDNTNNVLTGGAGDDEIRGRGGSDTLSGGEGNDRLRGDEGDDFLLGGGGNDRLRGDKGNDTLTGGAGNDRFIFNKEGGADTVTDFQNGLDKLDLTNFRLANADAALAAASQVGDNVVFTLAGGVTVTLEHVNLSVLDATDFLI